MIHFKARASSVAAIASLILFGASSLVNAQKIDAKIDAKIDVAVVIPVTPYPTDMDLMKDALRTLPQNQFEMGEQKAKVALVSTHPSDIVLQELTGDQTAFKNFLDGWKPQSTGTIATHTALAAIRERIFNFSDESRAKVAIVFIDHYPAMRRLVAQEGKLLREKGVRVYVVYNRDLDSGSLRQDAENIAGNQTSTIGIPLQNFHSSSIDSISQLKPFVFRDLCFWTTSCRYENPQRQMCKPDAWRPSNKPNYFNDNDAQCLTVKPNDTITCNLDDCVKECDRRWEWAGPLPDCNTTCGAVVKRKTDAPPEKLENCLAEFKCQLCPTTATAVPVPQTAGGTKTTPKAIKPRIGGVDTAETGEEGLEDWMIAVIVLVVIVLLLLVAAIIIILIVVKKKRATAATAAKAAEIKKKRAAAAAAEAAEMLRKKKMAMEAISKPMVKGSQSVSGTARAVSVMQAGAEASMAADVSSMGKTAKVSSVSHDKSMAPLPSPRGKSVP